MKEILKIMQLLQDNANDDQNDISDIMKDVDNIIKETENIQKVTTFYFTIYQCFRIRNLQTRILSSRPLQDLLAFWMAFWDLQLR